MTEIHEKPQNTEMCEYVASKALEMLFKWYQSQNDTVAMLIMQQLFVF